MPLNKMIALGLIILIGGAILYVFYDNVIMTFVSSRNKS